MAHDPDREYLGNFLAALFSAYSTNAFTVKNIVYDSIKNEDLREILVEVAAERDGTINKRKLGWWIKRHAGRMVEGLRIISDTTFTINASMWKIEKSVISVLSDFSGAIGKTVSDTERF
jgi:hypothetical protein